MKEDGFKNIQKVTGLRVQISPKMQQALREWSKAYTNDSAWLKDNVESLDLPSTIASEVARLVTIESTVEVSGSQRAEFINEQLNDYRSKKKNIVETACAIGGVIFKPFVSGSKLLIDYICQDEIFPFNFDGNGNITGVIFPTYKIKGDCIYTRLEIHNFNVERYTIENRAFVSKNTRLNDGIVTDIGHEIPLNTIEEWKDIEPSLVINGLDAPLYAYFRIPVANNIDRKSPLGVSVYARGIREIKKADIQWARIDWEYESKEAAIDTDESYIETDIYGSKILPKGKERLFRTYSSETMSTNQPIFQYYSPEIRDQSFFNGLDKIFKRIEYNCNLAYGTISDPSNVDKTAEEIKSSKQRSYQLVSDIQASLETALEALIRTIDDLCDIHDLAPVGNYSTAYSWDDSIVIDAEKEKLQDMQEVNNGLMSKWKYKVKWQGLTEEQAKAEIADEDGEGIDY